MEKDGSITEKKKERRGCLVVFFLIFFLAGCAAMTAIIVVPLYRIVMASGWEETPCKILESKVETHSDSDGSTYKVYIRYEYFYAPPGNPEKQRYVSDRYNFLDMSSSGYSGKKKVVSQYPVGSKKTCYVDPDDPAEAVISRGLDWNMLFGLIPLVFILVGGGGMYWAIFGKESDNPSISSKGKSGGWNRSGGAAKGGGGFRKPQARRVTSTGDVELQSTGSPIGSFIGVTFFALIWNGIVSVFLYQCVESWLRGDPEYFLTVFMIPFVLVGLGAIGGIIYCFLAIFNPRPVLRINDDRVHLGGSVSLKWSFKGGTGKISRLTVNLVGREEATYRRGTDTVTDKSEFFREAIADTVNPSEINTGLGEITIPFDTMHSFESANNKIVWELTVEGDIKLWPDVKESFKLEVLPLAPGDEI